MSKIQSGKAYEANISFYSGELNTKLEKGQKLTYNDSSFTAVYNGQTFSAPQLKGAIIRGWLVEDGKATNSPVEKRKNFKTVTTQEDERVVGSAHRKKPERINNASVAEVAQEQAADAKVVKKLSKNDFESAKSKLTGGPRVEEGITFNEVKKAQVKEGSDAMQEAKLVGKVKHGFPDQREAAEKVVVVSEEARKADLKLALEKRAQTAKKLAEKTVKQTTQKYPKNYPAESHWKTRLLWLKEHKTDTSVMKTVYTLSNDSFKNVIKREFPSLKLQ
jgi:hypothetical protein